MECFKYAFNILMHKYIPLQVSHTLTGVDYPDDGTSKASGQLIELLADAQPRSAIQFYRFFLGGLYRAADFAK